MKRDRSELLLRAGLLVLGVSPFLETGVFAQASPTGSSTELSQAIADCERAKSAGLAIRLCSRLLASPDLTKQALSRIYAQRGAAWLREDEPLAAVSDYDRALEAEGTNLVAIRGRAEARLRAGDKIGSIADWSKLIELSPDDASALLARAEVYASVDDSEASLRDYGRAIELAPRDPKSYVGRALVHDNNDRLDQALLDFEAALTADPDFIPAYVARAEMWVRRRNNEKAIADYGEALKLNAINLNPHSPSKSLILLSGSQYFRYKSWC